jgi:hypothetical protein
MGETCGTFGTKRNADVVLVGKCVTEIKEESYRRLEDGGTQIMKRCENVDWL